MGEAANTPQPTFCQRVGLWAYRAMCGVLRLCPVPVVAGLGRAIGYGVWLAAGSRRRIVERNLRICVDPTLHRDKLSSMVRRNIVRTCMNLACSLKTGVLTHREMLNCVEVQGADFFREHGMNGHTVISCIPHAGNWEMLARIRPLFPEVEHFGSMYRRMSNPLLEDLVYRSRTNYGCEMFSKEEGLRPVLKLARTGGLLGVLSDQFTGEGLMLPYFGKVTGVTSLPALLYKRCKGKGTLVAVYCRNNGTGKWDVVLDHTISVPEGKAESIPDITMAVNHALEEVQMENILDGLWMHHRWKYRDVFGIDEQDGCAEVRAANTKLPFRVLVAVPEEFEEALCLLPALSVIKDSRRDAQLIIVCPSEQKAFWQKQTHLVTYVLPTDGPVPLRVLLESDEIYNDGPLDYLFMFSDNARTLRTLRTQGPFYICGFDTNPLSGKFNRRYVSIHTGPPRPRHEDYLVPLKTIHELKTEAALNTPVHLSGNEEDSSVYLAPYSTLGTADHWPAERWLELAEHLKDKAPVLLILRRDEAQAEADFGTKLPRLILDDSADLADHIGTHSVVYAVDGVLAQAAALHGAQTTILMASRLPARYTPFGENVRTVSCHAPCHPCHSKSCDAPHPCLSQLSVNEVLATE